MPLQKLVRISILTVSLLSPAGIGVPASDSDVTAAQEIGTAMSLAADKL